MQNSLSNLDILMYPHHQQHHYKAISLTAESKTDNTLFGFLTRQQK